MDYLRTYYLCAICLRNMVHIAELTLVSARK